MSLIQACMLGRGAHHRIAELCTAAADPQWGDNPTVVLWNAARLRISRNKIYNASGSDMQELQRSASVHDVTQ